ncbi:MAG: biopolymer transporter ExbD [Gammaproteobacteria bacterium]|uniref:Biopolymer transporter ExbD n=4 Tax=OM182 clade TaxID=745002 RepID=A0A0R2SBJ9_9GAMM|nr:MAG: biopolymer transporter ExbD [OM182 bacterium BACL3 MAG-120507-bin80]KRO82109.1 MAG: biopolymer transporter ExbD [OM182 bacterium BACL3 MAG-120920-bin41]KRO83421.1 MAG: biopolymer transporter ExbD [OM182 bacterium BACL3 MAG-120619-bin3]KRP36192.1 MAG: biopolymer transporter ExbD [OM182 bacterium BACL3 MAG-120531-bin86]MBT4781476.1 biopolymer transporter ExbD [Gammaproteobacteria bacterium]
MKFRQVRRELPALNLTPLIDIVFLLLIFFMVTTSFSRETRLLVSLPEASGSAENATESIEVLVDKEGGYAINGRRLVNAEVDSLVRGLELESGGDVSLLVVLVADAEVQHQSVVTAMEAIGRAGFASLSIATREPIEKTQ